MGAISTRASLRQGQAKGGEEEEAEEQRGEDLPKDEAGRRRKINKDTVQTTFPSIAFFQAFRQLMQEEEAVFAAWDSSTPLLACTLLARTGTSGVLWWIGKLNNNFVEVKNFIATQVMDETRHTEVFRKCALTTGYGLSNRRARSRLPQSLQRLGVNQSAA